MAQFKIVLGDEGGDGHSIYVNLIVDVTDKYTMEELFRNYEKSCRELDIHPESFDSRYGDGMVGIEVINTMRKHGYVPSHKDYELDWTEFNDDGKTLYLNEDLFVDLLMFLVGYGLPDFEWKGIPDTVPVLISGVGYGMYLY